MILSGPIDPKVHAPATGRTEEESLLRLVLVADIQIVEGTRLLQRATHLRTRERHATRRPGCSWTFGLDGARICYVDGLGNAST
jgi:hypothetical protein